MQKRTQIILELLESKVKYKDDPKACAICGDPRPKHYIHARWYRYCGKCYETAKREYEEVGFWLHGTDFFKRKDQ